MRLERQVDHSATPVLAIEHRIEKGGKRIVEEVSKSSTLSENFWTE